MNRICDTDCIIMSIFNESSLGLLRYIKQEKSLLGTFFSGVGCKV